MSGIPRVPVIGVVAVVGRSRAEGGSRPPPAFTGAAVAPLVASALGAAFGLSVALASALSAAAGGAALSAGAGVSAAYALPNATAAIVTATMKVVDDAATREGQPADAALVDDWLAHRNDTSALQALTRKGYVVDTMEIAAPWSRLSDIYAAATTALMSVPHAIVASFHLSHSYLDGACLYFTFAATPPADEIESTYVAMWDAGQRAVLASGGNLSHHHGVGLNRARFAGEALGPAFDVLCDVKRALDPNGILNPGKLGLPSPFGDPAWP